MHTGKQSKGRGSSRGKQQGSRAGFRGCGSCYAQPERPRWPAAALPCSLTTTTTTVLSPALRNTVCFPTTVLPPPPPLFSHHSSSTTALRPPPPSATGGTHCPPQGEARQGESTLHTAQYDCNCIIAGQSRILTSPHGESMGFTHIGCIVGKSRQGKIVAWGLFMLPRNALGSSCHPPLFSNCAPGQPILSCGQQANPVDQSYSFWVERHSPFTPSLLLI